jgi:hypothetical protein
MVEKFIGNGKLVHFVAKHKTQPSQNWDLQPRDYLPRENRHRALSPWNDRNLENEPQEHDRRREEPRRERSRSRGLRLPKPRNQHVIVEICTIGGGFARGESRSDRKAYTRHMKNWEVFAMDKPLKSRKRETPVVGFSHEDYVGVSLPHTDALVITLQTIISILSIWIIEAQLTSCIGQSLCIWI